MDVYRYTLKTTQSTVIMSVGYLRYFLQVTIRKYWTFVYIPAKEI